MPGGTKKASPRASAIGGRASASSRSVPCITKAKLMSPRAASPAPLPRRGGGLHAGDAPRVFSAIEPARTGTSATPAPADATGALTDAGEIRPIDQDED
jgi:hypothetical protein